MAVQVAPEVHQPGFDVLRQTRDLVVEGRAGHEDSAHLDPPCACTRGDLIRMRLTSHRFERRPHDRLLGLRRTERDVAVVINAVDEPGRRTTREPRRRARAAGQFGLPCQEVDLRDHVDDEQGLEARLRELEVVWVRGGNVFGLRYAMALSGADESSRDVGRGRDGVRRYARPCSLAPSLRGLERCDDIGVIGRRVR